MDDNPSIQATGAEIREVVEAMEPILGDFPTSTVYLGCLALALVILNPEMDPEELAEGIQGASEWMTSFIDRLEDPLFKPVPSHLMN